MSKKCTSFASDGQQHSSGMPNVPVISSGWEGGSDVTTAELELCRLNLRTTLPFHFRCSFCFGERLGSVTVTQKSRCTYMLIPITLTTPSAVSTAALATSQSSPTLTQYPSHRRPAAAEWRSKVANHTRRYRTNFPRSMLHSDNYAHIFYGFRDTILAEKCNETLSHFDAAEHTDVKDKTQL